MGEFRNTDEDECTFCEISEAPIPRWLAAHDQKHRRGLRCVRPFRNVQKGPVVDISGFSDGVYPFEHLEALIEEVTGAKATHSKIRYPLHGTTLAQLTESFGEMQRSISNDTEEGARHWPRTNSWPHLRLAKKWSIKSSKASKRENSSSSLIPRCKGGVLTESTLTTSRRDSLGR